MTQEVINVLLIVALTASILVQVVIMMVLRELFYYLRGSHKGLFERMDYIVGGVDVLKEDNRNINRRLSELFNALRHTVCPYAEQKKTTGSSRVDADGK